MPKGLSYAVDPGGLSEADHERIFALAEKGWRSTRIARSIRKHPSTVGWFMYRHGLRPMLTTDAVREYVRGGRTVRRFTREEDAYIQALRIQDVSFADIARLTTARFGHPRHIHTIHCRLVMLAGQDEPSAPLPGRVAA